MPHRVALYSLALLLSAAISSNGQTWKSQYDLAIREYQAGEYPKAVVAAKQALKLVTANDQKSEAYTLQLITVIALDSGEPDEGLPLIAREAELFRQLEGPNSSGYTDALSKHARLLVVANQFSEAEVKCGEALTAMQSAGSDMADMNLLYAQVLASNKKPQEAIQALDLCLTQYAKDPDKGGEYIEALLLSAQLSEQVKDVAGAEKKYRQLSTVLEKNNLKDLPAYGESQTALSRLAVASGNKAEATQLLNSGAVEAGEKARQLLKIALDHQSSGQVDLAKENYLMAEKTISDGQLQNNTAFSVHVNFGRLMTRQRDFKNATDLLARATTLSKVLYQEPSSELAILNFSLGDLAIVEGQLSEAQQFYRIAKTNSAAMDLSLRLQYLTNASRKLLAMDLIPAAIALLEQDIALLPNKGVTEANFLETVMTYTQALVDNNQSDVAISKLKALNAASTSADTQLKLLCLEAAILEQAGRWSSALALLNEINKRPALSKELKAENDFLMGRLFLQLGNFSEAEKHLQSCLTALQKPEGEKQQGIVLDALNNLAMVYTKLGNYEKAENMYMDLLKQPEQVPGFHASIQQNLAALFVESARYTEAQLLLEDVLRQDLERYGDQHPDYATSLQNLAAVYLKSDQFDKARSSYEKALQITAKSGTSSLPYATAAANLGILYHESGDLAKARQYMTESLKIREAVLGKDHPDYVFNEYNLAKLLEEMGESQKALPYFRHVGSFYLHEIKELFRAMSEREKTAYYNKINEVITTYLDFAIKHSAQDKNLLGELYDFRLATKAMLLSSSTRVRSRILSSQDGKLMESYSSWLRTKEELGKLYSLSAADRETSKTLISSLQEKANQLEKILTSQSELFGEDASQDTVTWKSVKKHLLPGDVAIEFIRLGLKTKDSVLYAAIILRPENSIPQLVVFPQSPRMETKEFSYYRNTIHYRLANDRSYNFYWKPLAAVVKGAKRVFISPDGVFNKVNISTLYDPATSEYLLERHSIELVSNTKELVVGGSVRTAGQTASLFGHPNYGERTAPAAKVGGSRSTSTLAQSILGGGVPELPGTLEEVNLVDAFLKESKWQTSVFVSNAASEAAIKAQKNPGILHIATHGFFIEMEDNTPAVGGGDLRQSENNPLLRSGLILAGATNAIGAAGGDDGILTAYEAMSLTLDKTDLVVLSACETGAGEIKNGEGVYGLQRSFLVAGASNLLMSLWKVDDAATQELMLQFYKELQTTKDKPTAFRATQLEIRKKHPEPYYWGGFVLIGHN